MQTYSFLVLAGSEETIFSIVVCKLWSALWACHKKITTTVSERSEKKNIQIFCLFVQHPFGELNILYK